MIARDVMAGWKLGKIRLSQLLSHIFILSCFYYLLFKI